MGEGREQAGRDLRCRRHCGARPGTRPNLPDHPMKAISADPPGGPSDTMARLATQGA